MTLVGKKRRIIIIKKKRANGMDGVAHARAIYSADSPHNKTHTQKRTVNVRKKRAQHGSARGSAPLLFLITIKKNKIK